MAKIRLLLADDHSVLRAGLKALLNSQPDMEVVAEAADGEEAIQKCRETTPDIILLDITMPKLNGFEATQEIRRYNSTIKILVLTMHEDERYLYQMLQAGADSYVPKKAADTELLDAIRATHRGEHFIHSSMTTGLITQARHGHATEVVKSSDADVLSQREKEVLRLLAMGHTNQEIADIMYLSIKTVETYRTRLKRKLGLTGRAELVRYAIQVGLLRTET